MVLVDPEQQACRQFLAIEDLTEQATVAVILVDLALEDRTDLYVDFNIKPAYGDFMMEANNLCQSEKLQLAISLLQKVWEQIQVEQN